jgi:MFS family permease
MSDTVIAPGPAVPWYREITAKQWYALAAGQAGWALDAFDVMLYSFCLTTIMKEWHSTPAAAGFMVTVTLFASSLGGIAFGAVADRIGRKKALMLTVLLFSICSGLSGLTQNLTQLAIARTLLGLGMGGEWAAGALLVSETWPPQHRGKAVGIMQSGWAIGYILAAVCGWLVLPALGWRAMFFVGVLPALFTLWIRSKLEEPEIWVKAAAEHKAKATSDFGFFQIFAPDLVRFTLLSTLVSALVMFAYWGLFTWMPGFLSQPLDAGGAGLGVRGALWIIPMMTGAFFGYISFGFIADKLGRRPTFAAYLLISAVLVWIFGTTRDASVLLWLGPFLGFFGSGYFSAFGAFISELFPTRARGSAVGFCYNAGRMLSALAPTVVGALSVRYGLGGALALLAIAFVGGAASIYLLPETRGRQLT